MFQPAEFLNRILFKGSPTPTDVHILPVQTRYAIVFQIHTRQASQLQKIADVNYEAGMEIIRYIKNVCAVPFDNYTSVYEESISWNNQNLRARVSFLPTYLLVHAIHLRLLPVFTQSLSLRELGISKIISHCLQEALHSRKLILVAGETGQGKSTTVNTLLRVMQKDLGQIITLEESVEQMIPGAIQLKYMVSKNTEQHHSLLLASLRHDVQTFYLGEIKDDYTAHIALQTALSGQRVIATIHARSSSDALLRMEKFGIERSDLVKNLGGVLYQRLLPQPCQECCHQSRLSKKYALQLTRIKKILTARGLRCAVCVKAQLFSLQASGCTHCAWKKTVGSIALHEWKPVLSRETETDEKMHNAHCSLLHDALHKYIQKSLTTNSLLQLISEYAYN